jgi:hypothetical protein
MPRIGQHLTYANVVSTIALFLVLTGGVALAAVHLAKNSVGTKQLRKGAVTTAKINEGAVGTVQIGGGAVTGGQLANGAVSTAKLANGAVTGQKLAEGAVGTSEIATHAVTADKIDLASLPFSRIVDHIGGLGQVPFVNGTPYPLDHPTYVQPVGENDQFLGAIEVTFQPSCGGRRSANAVLNLEQPERGAVTPSQIGTAHIETELGGTVTRVGQFVPVANGLGATSASPMAPTPHTFSIEMTQVSCTTGSGVTLDEASVDVLGTR